MCDRKNPTPPEDLPIPLPSPELLYVAELTLLYCSERGLDFNAAPFASHEELVSELAGFLDWTHRGHWRRALDSLRSSGT